MKVKVPAPVDSKKALDKQRKRAYRTGMTKDTIVDEAVALTRTHGLEGWTTRQLARSLDTSLSVLAHHTGDRAALSTAVVDRVASNISLPDHDLSWRDWITELLLDVRGEFALHPGVAQWCLVNGRVTPAIAPLLDAAVSVLLDAGFGARAAPAYTVAFTMAVSHVALGDARSLAGSNHRVILGNLPPADERGRGLDAVAAMMEDFAAPNGPLEHYRYALDCVLDGIEAECTRRAAATPAAIRHS